MQATDTCARQIFFFNVCFSSRGLIYSLILLSLVKKRSFCLFMGMLYNWGLNTVECSYYICCVNSYLVSQNQPLTLLTDKRIGIWCPAFEFWRFYVCNTLRRIHRVQQLIRCTWCGTRLGPLNKSVWLSLYSLAIRILSKHSRPIEPRSYLWTSHLRSELTRQQNTQELKLAPHWLDSSTSVSRLW